MRKGEIGPVMWIVLGLLVLLAVLILLLGIRDTGFSLVDKIKGLFR